METKKLPEQSSNQETQTNEQEPTGHSNPDSRRTHVRFTKRQYRRILRRQIETGKCFQQLLKEALLKNGLSNPRLNPEDSKAVLGAILAIGQKVNLITKRANCGITEGLEEDISIVLNDCHILKSFLGLSDEKP